MARIYIETEHVEKYGNIEEQALAVSVITLAVKDFVRAKRGLNIKHINYKIRNTLEMVQTECYDFLTGFTDISDYWFTCADIRPFTPNELNEMCNKTDMLEKLDGSAWVRKGSSKLGIKPSLANLTNNGLLHGELTKKMRSYFDEHGQQILKNKTGIKSLIPELTEKFNIKINYPSLYRVWGQYLASIRGLA